MGLGCWVGVGRGYVKTASNVTLSDLEKPRNKTETEEALPVTPVHCDMYECYQY